MTAARARPAAKRAAKAGAMSAEAVRAHCLSFPHASEVIQWGDHPVFKIAGKMFAVLGSGAPGSNALSFKCADDSFAILTQLPGIVPAPYLARAKWVALERFDALPESDLRAYLRRAYDVVVARLPRKTQRTLGLA